MAMAAPAGYGIATGGTTGHHRLLPGPGGGGIGAPTQQYLQVRAPALRGRAARSHAVTRHLLLSAAVQEMSRLVNNADMFPDVVFVVQPEGQRAYGHRAVLATRSPFFAAMFLGGMRESREEAVEISDVSYSELREQVPLCNSHCYPLADAFVILLHFIYTDTLPPGVSPEDAVEVYAAADQV
jgi:hypothetical protein